MFSDDDYESASPTFVIIEKDKKTPKQKLFRKITALHGKLKAAITGNIYNFIDPKNQKLDIIHGTPYNSTSQKGDIRK